MKRPLVLVSVLLAAVIAVCFGLFPDSADPFLKNRKMEGYRDSLITVRGTVKSYEEKDGYAVLLIKNTLFSSEESGKKVTYRLHGVRVTLKKPAAEYGIPCRAGQTVLVRGVLHASAEPSDPGQFNEALHDRIHHISWRMKKGEILAGGEEYSALSEAAAVLRRKLYRRLCQVYPEDTREVLGAVLLGRKEELSSETSVKYESGGVSHMLVISSLHLSILSAAVFGILRKCRCSLKGSILAGGSVLVFFVILTGCSLSALRAVIVYLFSMGAKWTGRTYDRRNAAAFAAILMLLSDPFYLFYSSFQLSFAAAVLCIFSENKGKTAGCVIIQFGMMPLIAWHFFEIPLFGVPINLILLPFLPAILITGAAGLLFGGYSVLPAVYAVRLYDRILSLLQRAPDSFLLFGKRKIPFRAVWITGRPGIVRILCYYAVFALFLYLLFLFQNTAGKLSAYLLLPVLLLVIGVRPAGQAKITFLDVGQGDGICVESPHGSAMLVDGGSSDVFGVGQYRILPFIKYCGIGELEVLAVTHADEDHMNGILAILEMMADRTTALRAKYLILPEVMEPLSREEEYIALEKAAEKAGLTVLKVRRGDSFFFDGMEVEILGPEEKDRQTEADANAQCIVMAVRYGQFDALLTGDAEGEGEEKLLGALKEQPSGYEVLKVAHHGSKYSTPGELLDIVCPEISIISAGKNNRYGHPHEETLARLRACGTAVYATAESGAVTVKTDGRHFSVRTWNSD
ncbi:MAG: DNA internalization-related competence protein ComEC/Rec2 [Lachnospiraceae bacterium]|nr:DNA internalization-related competence protein ComEC/Rec2 [Lachnospiraceae bacterium]